MLKQLSIMATMALPLAVGGCTDSPTFPSNAQPAFRGVPADGNGTKQVITFDVEIPDFGTCPNGASLDIRADGWMQVRLFTQEASPRVELDVFHTIHTWTNAAGETFVDREIGPDRYYLDHDGNLILAITGRVAAEGVIGQLVINLTTGEVIFVTGPGFPDHLELACDALT
jgi:hypothetical protein